MVTEALGSISDGYAVFPISFSKESEVICKENVRDFEAFSTYGYGDPVENIHLIVNSPRQEFHTHDEKVRREGGPCLIPLVDL